MSTETFTVTSETTPDGSVVAQDQLDVDMGGGSVSPDLSWSNAPAGTKSFAVTCYDPDAPTGSGFWHWVAWDIPASQTSLPVGVARDAAELVQATNDAGRQGYDGPYPPAGPVHHYVFSVHALPVETLDIPADAPHVQARFAIFSQQLDQASLTATYQVTD